MTELTSIMPKSAGEYIYIRTTYAHWLGFMCAWTRGFLIRPSSLATVSMTTATYMIVPVYNDGCGEPPALMIKMLAAAIMCRYAISLVIYFGIVHT